MSTPPPHAEKGPSMSCIIVFNLPCQTASLSYAFCQQKSMCHLLLQTNRVSRLFVRPTTYHQSESIVNHLPVTKACVHLNGRLFSGSFNEVCDCVRRWMARASWRAGSASVVLRSVALTPSLSQERQSTLWIVVTVTCMEEQNTLIK